MSESKRRSEICRTVICVSCGCGRGKSYMMNSPIMSQSIATVFDAKRLKITMPRTQAVRSACGTRVSIVGFVN